MQKFKGSFVIVSHDRYFLAEVANKIWYIENRQLKEYPGTYAEYEAWVEKQAAVANVAKTLPEPPKPAQLKKPSEDQQQEKEKKKQHQKLSTRIKELEQKTGKA